MAIKLFGDDLALLEEKSKQIEDILGRIPGAVDIFRGRLSGQKYLRLSIRQPDIARYGIRTEDINQMIETAVGTSAGSGLLKMHIIKPV